jgi:hypothetical protein
MDEQAPSAESHRDSDPEPQVGAVSAYLGKTHGAEINAEGVASLGQRRTHPLCGWPERFLSLLQDYPSAGVAPSPIAGLSPDSTFCI